MDYNSTKLGNSYLFGKANRVSNYFRHFNEGNKTSNCKNDIDDPIFTGFTFVIDGVTSPLFSFNEYTNMSDDGLMGKIENKLAEVYSKLGSDTNYMLHTNTMDTFSDGKTQIGYGLKPSVTTGSDFYGAVEYIYMVDKVATTSSTDSINNSMDLSDSSSGDNNSSSDISVTSVESSSTGDSDETVDNSERIEELREQIAILNGKIASASQLDENAQKLLDNYNEVKANIESAQSKLSTKQSIITSYVNLLGNIQERCIYNIIESSGDIDSLYGEFTSWLTQAQSAGCVVTYSTDTSTSNKKQLAKEQCNDESKYKLLDQKHVEILSALIDEDSTVADELSELNYFTNSLQIEHVLDGESKTLEEWYNIIKNSPTEYQNWLTERASLQKELDNLLATQSTSDDSGDSDSDDNTSTVTTTTTTEVSDGTSLYNETDSTSVPQTVKDMVGFINGMEKLITYYPYMFLNISGLDTAYSKQYTVGDAYLGSGDDTISIECLESLDLKVSSMFNKYLSAAYDRHYRRERLPMNLRKFNCSVFVHDIRNFRYALQKLNETKFNIGDTATEYIIELALNYVSVVEFKFYDCEIVPEETGNIFGSVSNEEGSDPLKTNFTFKYGNCVVNFLPFEDLYNHYTGTGSSSYEPTLQENSIDPDSNSKTYSTDYTNNLTTLNTTTTTSTGYSAYSQYYDRSVLGNVNSDDYLESVKTDYATAVSDLLRDKYANMFAENSAAQLYSADADAANILKRTVYAISASVGEPPITVADAMGMGTLITSIYNPAPTSISEDLGNVIKSSTDPRGRTSKIGTADVTSTEGDVVEDLSSLTDKGKMTGQTKTIDKVNVATESTETTETIGVRNVATNPSGISNEIGDMDFNTDSNFTVEGIGLVDVIGNAGEHTEDLGKTKTTANPSGLTTDLEGIDLSHDATGSTDSIGKTNLSAGATDYTNEIGEVNVSTEPGDETEKIGYVNVSQNASDFTSEIGEVNVSANPKGSTTGIGLVDVIGNAGDATENIGLVNVSTNPSGTTNTIGEVNVSTESTGSTDSIGLVDVVGNAGDTTNEIGLVDVVGESTGNTDNIGLVDVNANPSGSTTGIGLVDVVGESTGNTNNIGLVDVGSDAQDPTNQIGLVDVIGESTGSTDSIGLVDVIGDSTGTTDNIGLVDVVGNAVDNTTEIGLVNVTAEASGATDSIGSLDVSGDATGSTSSIGDMDMSGDATGSTSTIGDMDMSTTVSGTNTNIGQMNVDGDATGVQDVIGNVITTSEPIGLTDEIGNLNDTITVNGSTKDLGQFNTSSEPTGEQGDIGNNVNMSVETPSKNFEDLGNVFLS